MKKLLLSLVLVAAAAMCANAAKVVYTINSLTYTESTESGEIKIIFQKCMTNKLYTFYEVYLNNTLVNSSATSDNIGPFFADYTWMGGNHNTPQGGAIPSAYTRDVRVYVDGEELAKNKVKNNISVLKIEVDNELFYQNASGTLLNKFCDENMTYTVSGNTIDVFASHAFHNTKTSFVSKYYGAQSMFPATSYLLPGANGNKWATVTPYVSAEKTVKKSECPGFSTFIEKSANGYQAVYKFPEGMGDGSRVADTAPIFIWANYGGATGKSYHVMMYDHNLPVGTSTTWHAMYSWFKTPITDTFATNAANPVFEYQAYQKGTQLVMHIDSKGKMSGPSGIENITVESADESAAPVAYYNLNGIKVENPTSGLYIAKQANGKAIKTLIK